MITIEKINIYKKYDGDIDMWIRLNSKLESFMEEKDWYEIDSLLQGLRLIKTGQVSERYGEELNKNLNKSVKESRVIDILRDLV